MFMMLMLGCLFPALLPCDCELSLSLSLQLHMDGWYDGSNISVKNLNLKMYPRIKNK